MTWRLYASITSITIEAHERYNSLTIINLFFVKLKIIVYEIKTIIYNKDLIQQELYMARPMVLMQEKLLHSLHEKAIQGVPVLALIRQHNLYDTITAPTLTKLLKYMKARGETTDSSIKTLIDKSLFPAWLKKSTDNVVQAPPDYFYSGAMPLGKWSKREVA